MTHKNIHSPLTPHHCCTLAPHLSLTGTLLPTPCLTAHACCPSVHPFCLSPQPWGVLPQVQWSPPWLLSCNQHCHQPSHGGALFGVPPLAPQRPWQGGGCPDSLVSRKTHPHYWGFEVYWSDLCVEGNGWRLRYAVDYEGHPTHARTSQRQSAVILLLLCRCRHPAHTQALQPLHSTGGHVFVLVVHAAGIPSRCATGRTYHTTLLQHLERSGDVFLVQVGVLGLVLGMTRVGYTQENNNVSWPCHSLHVLPGWCPQTHAHHEHPPARWSPAATQHLWWGGR